ncbi:hypothetical protein [Micromonospora haikouensis]|uniref:hypothetical protein n=1 Tax=Micromonospora haikouensis TaxID=686309 RepID=UPI003D75881B
MTNLDKLVFDWAQVHAPAPALTPAELADTVWESVRQPTWPSAAASRLEVGRIVWLRLTELAGPTSPMPGQPPITSLYGLPITTPDDMAPDAWRLIATDGTALREGRVSLP